MTNNRFENDDSWAKSPQPCPECGGYFHAGLSGMIEPGMTETMPMEDVADICVVAPETHRGMTTIYVHPESFVEEPDDA